MGEQREDELLTLPKAAEMTGRDLQNLQKAAQRGRLKARKIGRDWVVTRKDLQAWLDDPTMHKRKP